MNIDLRTFRFTSRRALLCGATVALLAVPVLASAKIFVGIEGIPGEATEAPYAGQIEADTVSLGFSSPIDPATGALGTRRVLAPVTISKRADKATPVLMSAGASGKPIPSLVIVSTRAVPSGPAVAFQTVTLSDAVVSDWRLVDGPTGAIEQVSFAAGGIAISYAQQDTSGRPAAPITGKVSRK